MLVFILSIIYFLSIYFLTCINYLLISQINIYWDHFNLPYSSYKNSIKNIPTCIIYTTLNFCSKNSNIASFFGVQKYFYDTNALYSQSKYCECYNPCRIDAPSRLAPPKKVMLPGKCFSLNYHMKRQKDLMAHTFYNWRSMLRFGGHHLTLPSYGEITICHAQASSN